MRWEAPLPPRNGGGDEMGGVGERGLVGGVLESPLGEKEDEDYHYNSHGHYAPHELAVEVVTEVLSHVCGSWLGWDCFWGDVFGSLCEGFGDSIDFIDFIETIETIDTIDFIETIDTIDFIGFGERVYAFKRAFSAWVAWSKLKRSQMVDMRAAIWGVQRFPMLPSWVWVTSFVGVNRPCWISRPTCL